MNKHTRFKRLVLEALFKRAWSQKDLADKMHVVEGTVTHWLKGRNAVSARNLQKMATLLDIPVDTLVKAQAELTKNIPTTDKNMEGYTLTLQLVPKLSWDVLANSSNWEQILTQLRKGKKVMEYEKISLIDLNDSQLDSCFAIQMISDEMTSQFYSEKIIPSGTIMFVDINLSPKNGDIVIGRTNNKKLVVGVYTEHGTHTTLNFLNQAYSPLDLKNVKIEGVVIETRRKCRSLKE